MMACSVSPAISQENLLNVRAFNQYVIDRSRSPSPNRSRSPVPYGGASDTNMDDLDTYNIPVPFQSIGCQELLNAYKCSHCGWLRKRRKLILLNWPQAYVVLYDGSLYYYSNERARSPSGKFSLYGYNSVLRETEIQPKETPWAFKIVHSIKEFKTYYFCAPSEQEMKTWMNCIKKEMLRANGQSSVYSSKLDEKSFYQDVEKDIYNDGKIKFVPTADYQKKCSIKRENEESDDEDLPVTVPDIDNRPPLPLPFDRRPAMEEPPMLAPPEFDSQSLDRPPPKPVRVAPQPDDRPSPRRRIPTPKDEQEEMPVAAAASPSNVKTLGNAMIGELSKALQQNTGKRSKLKRRGSYEKTDLPEDGSPTENREFVHMEYRSHSSGGGGSTGEDEADHVDTEEYWASIHFDEHDKGRAQRIIEEIGENGVYLVRPAEDSASSTGKTLVVFANDASKKYRIQMSVAGEYYLAEKGYRDTSLENLLCYYYENDLPTVKIKLKEPYRLHHKFKSLRF